MEFIKEKNRIMYVDDNNRVLAYVTFPKLDENTVNINHTVVDPSLRGMGIASKLLKEVVVVLKDNYLKAVPSCSYAADWFNKHPEYSDLLSKN